MTGNQGERILRGPPVAGIPECSLAEYLVPKIRALQKDRVIQVQADDGAVQTPPELLGRSVRLSEGLRKMGVEEGDVVGMMCRNSFAATEIVLATWLSGAVISPVDGSVKLTEMKHVLGLTKPKVIFAEEEVVGNLRTALNLLSTTATVVVTCKIKDPRDSTLTLEDILVDVDVERYEPRPVRSPSDQLVAILLSSGTSGLQKGVGITHRNLIFQDVNMESHPTFKFVDDMLQVSQFYWVTGVLTFLRTLTAGTKRILLKTATTTSVLKAIEEHRPKWTLIAPLFLLGITSDPDFDKFDVSSMQCVYLGGSPFSPSIAERVKEKWSDLKIVQGYGTTEVSGSVCVNDGCGDVFALGRVTPGVEVKIVDPATGELLKANARGEICVRSPGVMKGYVENEAATKESKDADGWIRTGDLGYYDDSGLVYLVDRMKEMIKVMNMQVAPAEIESTIITIPGVLEAGVVGVTRDGVGQEPMALVVKEKNSSVTEEDVYSHVASTLSDYKKLTGGVHFVESLPKTASGKLRRSELRKIGEELHSER